MSFRQDQVSTVSDALSYEVRVGFIVKIFSAFIQYVVLLKFE